MKKDSIEQVELSIAAELEVPFKAALKRHGYPTHDGFRLRLSFLQANGRKKRSNADASAWAPEKGERGQFWLEPCRAELVTHHQLENPSVSDSTHEDVAASSINATIYVHPAEAELVKALDRAESTPGWTFVALKKFRDEILPTENIPSLRTDVERQNVLRSAIEKKLILKKPVFNPKSPQFPVTGIRVNRLLPEVQQLLGHAKKDLDFHPIHIKGEPLSATILRERR